tara:strand:+ start:1063 stop:1332 length:270 start_codon:yes stop_codon:yes gene_type:complete
LLRARAFLVGLPFGFFMAPLLPFILAQKDFFLPFSRLESPLVLVTGRCNLEPVAALILRLPLSDNPPVGFLSDFLRDKVFLREDMNYSK